MPSPFPGMHSYLEAPWIWPDVHHGLISESQAALNPTLRPRYVARVELRIYISDDDDPGRQALVPGLRVERGPRQKGTKKAYDVSVDYRTDPQPPLKGNDAKWARELRRGRGGK